MPGEDVPLPLRRHANPTGIEGVRSYRSGHLPWPLRRGRGTPALPAELSSTSQAQPSGPDRRIPKYHPMPIVPIDRNAIPAAAPITWRTILG